MPSAYAPSICGCVCLVIKIPAIVQMLSYGCTRLEIGLQSIYEDVARDTNRGHTVAAVGECFRLAKDAGFKVPPRFPNTMFILMSTYFSAGLTCQFFLLVRGPYLLCMHALAGDSAHDARSAKCGLGA